jgi:Peptidase family M1 domain
MLRGTGLLRYRNHSPDTLRTLVILLAQNLFRDGAPHNESVPVTGGIVVQTMCVSRQTNAPAATLCRSDARDNADRLTIDNTVAWLALPTPLLPGDSVDLRARWEFAIPTKGAPRMGTDGAVTMMAYWYPQFAVYDDVAGWATDPYLATGEFYMDQAEYDVRVTVPRGYLIGATGVLQNASEVLSPEVRQRLQQAARSFAPMSIVSDSLRRSGGATLSQPTLTWHFTAPLARDFAFYLSRDILWDAMSALVPRAGGVGSDTILIHALYRVRARAWRNAADYGRQSIEHFSRLLWPYPWPQMTLVEGVVDGGMEYPMLTAVSVGSDTRELLATLGHEVGHMWFPMQVSSDERRFAWMDEGLASWLERSVLQSSTGHDDDDDGIPDLYRTLAGIGTEQSMLTHADHYKGGLTFTEASYDKLVVVLRAFAAEYGDSTLLRGLRAYGAAWYGRHPYPPDFTRMVLQGAGSERDAFAKEWVQGTGHFDAGIDDVERMNDTLTVTIGSHGGAHLSVPVVVMREDGRSQTITVPATAFRRDSTQTLRIGGARSVTSITIDPTRTRPDLNTANQRWAP